MEKSSVHKTAGTNGTSQLKKEEAAPLKRQISFVHGVAITMGAMIGSGIFVSPKGVAKNVESVGAILVVWTVCGGIILIQALNNLELTLMVKESGSTYTYIRLTLGDAWAFIVNIKAALISNPSSDAIISLTCAEYLASIFFTTDDCGNPPEFIVKGFATVAICLVFVYARKYGNLEIPDYEQTEFAIFYSFDFFSPKGIAVAANCYEIKTILRVQVLFTTLKVAILLGIVALGLARIIQGHTDNFTNSFAGTTSEPANWAFALLQGLFSFGGWFSLAAVSEEIHNPARTLPRVFFVSLLLVTSLYVMTNVSYFTVMTPVELVNSPAVAMTWGKTAIPNFYWLMSLGVGISTLGYLFVSNYLHPRRYYVASRYGHLPAIMSMSHITRQTPMPALIIKGILACCFIHLGSATYLIKTLTLFNSFFKLIGGFTIIILRFIKPNVKRPYKAHVLIIIISTIINMFLVIAPLIGKFRLELIYGFLFMLGAYIAYIPVVHFKVADRFMPPVLCSILVYFPLGPVTCFLQQLMCVCPTLIPTPYEGDDTDHIPKCPMIPSKLYKRKTNRSGEVNSDSNLRMRSEGEAYQGDLNDSDQQSFPNKIIRFRTDETHM